jgi:hypothetical protein
MRSGRQTWFSLAMESAAFAFEAQQVIALRMAKLAAGGAAAQAEAARMISEKMFAGAEASMMLALGRSPRTVMLRTRRHVRANARRLRASQHK